MPDHADAPLIPETHPTPSAETGPAQGSIGPGEIHDAEMAARVEAFVNGQPQPLRVRAGNVTAAGDTAEEALGSREPASRARRPFVLDTRFDWMMAVRREEARHVRYGRPVSVLLLELSSEASGSALDRVARDVTDLIRDHARGTDRAVRLAARSFRILMPETPEPSARAAAVRLERTYRAMATGRPDGTVRIELATPTRSRSLVDAVAEAEERLGIADWRRMSPSA